MGVLRPPYVELVSLLQPWAVDEGSEKLKVNDNMLLLLLDMDANILCTCCLNIFMSACYIGSPKSPPSGQRINEYSIYNMK